MERLLMTDRRRPNVLFIMTDQQRYDALGCHGGQAVTPNLDQLAQEGVDIHRFHTQSPVCVPSRCNLFSGRYPHSHRVRENNARLDPHEVHLFKALKQSGYSLGYVGKNHLLQREEFENFDHVDLLEDRRSQEEGERADFLAFRKARGAKLREVASWASACFHDFAPEVTDPYLSRESAVEFLESAPTDRPFCLTVSFSDPHAPHVAPRKFEAMYPLNDIALPDVPEGVLKQKAPRFEVKQQAQGAPLATDEDRQRYLAVYYAMISWVDENVGAILSALDRLGRREDTIIVFTSDHGDFNFHYGMCKKDLVLLDCLLHVPCLISWKGRLAPRQVTDALVEQVDVLPTLLELCGTDVPFGCQGQSLVPLLEGRTDHHRDEVHAEICPPTYRNPYKTYDAFRSAWEEGHETPGHPLCWSAPFNVPGDYCKMIRTESLKYVWYHDGFEELYDLCSDPGELVNLAGEEAWRGRCAEMRLRLLEWNAQSEDPLDPMWHRRHLKEYDCWNA
jgi:arylsulfatase